jgi:hypothetical protein
MWLAVVLVTSAGALFVSWGYCTLMLLGEAGAMIAPRFMRRRFQL